MSVTLEQVHILMNEMQMDTGCFQHALDAMRRWATVVYLLSVKDALLD